jgi:Flp pilus assembly protein TadB
MTRKRNKVSPGRHCSNCGAMMRFSDRCCPHCERMMRDWTISVSGTKAQEVQKVSLALMKKAAPPRTSPSPWLSGSFYLVVFLMVFALVSVAGHWLPIYALPLVLIGGILALSIIGAFQLRQDERLSEDNFVKLMALSFKYLPWLRRREKNEQEVRI